MIIFNQGMLLLGSNHFLSKKELSRMSGSIPQVLLKIKVFISRELNLIIIYSCLFWCVSTSYQHRVFLLLKLNYRTTFLLPGCQVNCGIVTVAFMSRYTMVYGIGLQSVHVVTAVLLLTLVQSFQLLLVFILWSLLCLFPKQICFFGKGEKQ